MQQTSLSWSAVLQQVRWLPWCKKVLYTGTLLYIYTLCPRKNGPPNHALNFPKLVSFAQFQFNSMNICLLFIKVPILVKICPTVIEILTFNNWSQKCTVSRSVISYLQSMGLTDVSIDAIVALAKQKQTKWCLVPKILF